nr:hypothetical protein [Neptunicella marina]
MAPVALITFVWQWFALPDMPANHQKKKLTAIFSHLSDHRILLGFIAITFLFSGQFSLFTYIRPFLEITAGVNSYTLSGILLLIGIAGFIGTTFINLFLRAKFYLTLALMPLIMAMMAALMILLAKDISLLVVILIIWGLVATAAPVGWWTWISQTMNHDPEAGGGLMVAVVQLAIALGSTSGGLLFDQFGYQTTFCFSAVLLILGSVSVIKLNSITNKSTVLPN